MRFDRDVRMRGFRDRVSVEAALAAALDGVERLEHEQVALAECAGRVVCCDVKSEVDVPAFRRATMDGFALRAADTYGASMYNPVPLRISGESLPGVTPPVLAVGGAVRIMTGAPVPDAADAVLRAEDASDEGEMVEVRAAVAEGKNVGRIGEDIARGDVVVADGVRLLPQHAGVLASIGVGAVDVIRRPHVRVVVSGNELLAPGSMPHGTSIVDSNSPMLGALIQRDGGTFEVISLPDDEAAMRRALADSTADVVVTAGAASVGIEDRVPMLVAELGDLLVHGVTMRPSSPTGVGRVAGRPVLILPGNPVSCLVAYDFFAGPVIRRMGGLPAAWPYRSQVLPLATRIVSQIGRTDYSRVVVEGGQVRPVAISGAAVLSSVTRASGFVVVPAELEGYAEGALVEVFYYDDGSG
jgi:molybdopterin molybdotransferase